MTGVNNVYDVTVSATDGTLSTEQAVTVTVTNCQRGAGRRRAGPAAGDPGGIRLAPDAGEPLPPIPTPMTS